MRSLLLSLLLYLGYSLHGAAAQPGFTYGYAPRRLGSADNYGYGIWTSSLGEMNFNGQSVPLRIFFTSDPRPPMTPSPLGRGWVMPFFSSALVEVDRDSLRWHRPDGRIFYFNTERVRPVAGEKKSKVIVYKSIAGEWQAVKESKLNRYVLTHLNSGSQFIYEDGLLVRFCFLRPTDGVDQFLISYTKQRSPVRVSETGSGRIVAEFIYEGSTEAKELRVFSSSGLERIWSFRYIQEKLAQFSTGPYLSRVDEGGTVRASCSYAVEGGLNVITFEGADRSESISWDPASGFLVKDSASSYKIENPSLINGGRSPVLDKKAAGANSSNTASTPQAYNWKPDQAKITRNDREGRTESSYYDRSKGVNTETSRDGVVTRTYYLLTPGPMMNKVRKIEVTNGGKVSVIVRNAYDELGRLTRTIDSKGLIEIREYLDGGLMRVIRDGRVSKEVRYVGGKMVSQLEFTEGGTRETTWGRDGLSSVLTKQNGEIKPDISVDYDERGRRKRYVGETSGRVSEYEYTDGGYTETIFKNGNLWARDYYDTKSNRYKTIYANGQEAAWFFSNGELLQLLKGADGKLGSASRIVNSKYVKSASGRQEVLAVVGDFLERFPSKKTVVDEFLASCVFN